MQVASFLHPPYEAGERRGADLYADFLHPAAKLLAALGTGEEQVNDEELKGRHFGQHGDLRFEI